MMIKQSVLIVDDEQSIRVSLKCMLEKEKYQVETAYNGSKALQKLENNHYDIVLTDIKMDNISGINLLQNIKEKYSDVLVLLMTGYSSIESAIDALRLGASDYILKPCSKNKILSSLSEVIKKNTPYENINPSQDIYNSLKVISGKKPFTNKELLVCESLLLGLTSRVIATKLDVTLATIKLHLQNI